MEWKTFTTFVLYNDACQSMNMQKRVNVITHEDAQKSLRFRGVTGSS